jgi:ATP-dependent Zn protease
MAAPCLLVFEDLDAMIDDKNRAFFLNELDGFESNKGLVVLATTNHPDRLDPAILNRPSRFDRKYHFDLPAASERSAYIAAWNKQLQPELRLSENEVGAVVQQTEDFSFAYLKELFVSATMQWMSTKPEPGADQGARAGSSSNRMDRIILEEVARLRAQMVSLASAATGGRVSRAVAGARRIFQKGLVRM